MDAIQPASLSYLAIYNPALGRTDETLHEQIVYYYPLNSGKPQKGSGNEPKQEDSGGGDGDDVKNERLRQIGLAQGMVEFAKAFSDGKAVDAIDSEKSRILLHELEPGWWLLASIELTRIERPPPSSKSKTPASNEPSVEYSAREVSPQDLLLQQLLRAHSIFLLHHAPSLSDLWIRVSRQRFCHALEKFWNRFIRDWDVLLHGSPAVDIYNGVNLSAGGELGIGVGEEEWGSGEREVLEGFIDRTDGLVDMVVSRFGDAEPADQSVQGSSNQSEKPWIGSGAAPSSTDGMVFSGVGAVTRPSLRSLSAWMNWIYKYGTYAYGVHDNPGDSRRKRRRKRASPPKESPAEQTRSPLSSPGEELPPGIPPPIFKAANRSLETATQKAENEPQDSSDAPNPSDTMLKYMTLGIYGSNWGATSSKSTTPVNNPSPSGPEAKAAVQKALRQLEPRPDNVRGPDVDNGCFLIGLQGSLEEDTIGSDNEDGPSSDDATDASTGPAWKRRLSVRTVYIELDSPSPSPPSSPPPNPRSLRTHFDRLRVVIYARRPFLFTFLFNQRAPTLSLVSLYRTLHHHIGPLQRPLLSSTSPAQAQSRKTQAVLSSPRTIVPSAEKGTAENPIYDLVWDPKALSITSTLPAIPEGGTLAAEGLGVGAAAGWTRLDALNVHGAILAAVKDTRSRPTELERTVKTARGWWVVWMRLPPEKTSSESERTQTGDGASSIAGEAERSEARRGELLYREAVLVRKASDHVTAGQVKKGWMGGGGSGAQKESAWGGAGRVVEGIGVDARRYVEGLLSVGR